MRRKIIGTHSPSVPCLTDGLPCILLAVLVEDACAIRVAYIGIVSHPTTQDQEQENASRVAAQGKKLSYEEAQKHWPSLVRRQYQ